MKIDILTIFPEMCLVPLGESIMKRAREAGILDLEVHNLRDFATDKHRRVDDEPFGGGQGMVMKPEPIFAAVAHLKQANTQVVLMTPQGQRFDQRLAESLAAEADRHLIIICGHYEGVDHRVVESLVDWELSIGDYVLTNGAIAAVIVVDAVVRLLPGALGDERSSVEESFSENLLEAPCYTRPADFSGHEVPDILLSGNHAKIAEWKAQMAEQRTRKNRPDLLD